MPRYFPSKKVFVVGVLAMAILAWSLFWQGTAQQRNSAIHTDPLISVAHAESAFPDSDGDGLYDWEETLYGTDPNSPDSDRNGIEDGEQYEVKHKDLGVRLSDSVYVAINRIGEEAAGLPDPSTMLSKEPPKYEPPFALDDVQVSPNPDIEVEPYLAITMATLLPHESVLEQDPLKLVDEWMQTKDPAVMEEIQQMAQDMKDIAITVINIPSVPEAYAPHHLDLANDLFLSGISLEDFENTSLDPMGGFFAIANYVNYQSKFLDAFFEFTNGLPVPENDNDNEN